MSNAAICGRTCAITIGSASYSAHKFSYSLDGKEEDITTFGASEFGEWMYCIVNGEVMMDCYDIPLLGIGDTVTVLMTFGFTPNVTISVPGVVKSIKNDVDAKGVAMFSIGVKMNGAATTGS